MRGINCRDSLIKDYYQFLHDSNIFLVCVGGGNFKNGELELFGKYSIKSKVIQLDVSDSQLVWLYKNAEVFIFPSIYEGFGLPILEAFRCKCPVILSNSSCFPEIAQDSAVYFKQNEEKFANVFL